MQDKWERETDVISFFILYQWRVLLNNLKARLLFNDCYWIHISVIVIGMATRFGVNVNFFSQKNGM